jgi:hypothetical protein
LSAGQDQRAIKRTFFNRNKCLLLFAYDCILLIGFGSDLASLNIQRGRDHGIPSYNEIRKLIGLASITSMSDRPSEFSAENWDSLASVYKQPDDIDAYPAGLAESPLPGWIYFIKQ